MNERIGGAGSTYCGEPGRAEFLDTGEDVPGLIELIQDNETTRGVFTSVWRTSVDWDGSRPVRDFAELLPVR